MKKIKLSEQMLTNLVNKVISERQQIKELTDKLSANGVPDTVAYISKKEVMRVSADLAKLGYREQEYSSLFQAPTEPISFVVMNLR